MNGRGRGSEVAPSPPSTLNGENLKMETFLQVCAAVLIGAFTVFLAGILIGAMISIVRGKL